MYFILWLVIWILFGTPNVISSPVWLITMIIALILTYWKDIPRG